MSSLTYVRLEGIEACIQLSYEAHACGWNRKKFYIFPQMITSP